MTILFILLNLIDCALTYVGIKLGLSEGNIFLSMIFADDLFFGLLIKMLLCSLVAYLLIQYNKRKLLKILCIAFVLIIVWNVFMLLMAL